MTTDNEPLTRAETAELDRLGSTFTPPLYDALERALRLRAHSLGWTGGQLPGRAVLAACRQVVREIPANAR